MRLRSNDASSDETAAETEADERTVNDGTVDDSTVNDSAVDGGTAVRPTFTPADEVADPDVPDDVAAQRPTVIEQAGPADNYAREDEARQDYADGGYEATDVGTPVVASEVVEEDDYTDAETDEPAVRYAEVKTFDTAEPADDYADGAGRAADEPAAYDNTAAANPAAYDDTPAAYDTAATATPSAATAQAAPATTANLDQPLLSGDTELLSQWQRVQAEFVDDPQVAVSGAAELVEQAGQALVDALQQRQRQMRSLWDHSGDGAGTPGDGAADTEQLRQMMQRYRALFNQLYQPV
jgi:hypothetical protein